MTIGTRKISTMFFRKKSYPVSNGTSVASSEKPQDDIRIEKNPECGTKSTLTGKHSPFLAFLFTTISSILFILTSVIVKKLTYMSPAHLSLIRNAFMFTGCLPVAIYTTKEVIGARKDRLKLFARGLLGATALFLNLNAARYLPLAEVFIVMSTTPALTSVIAFFYLKEPFGVVQGFGIVLTTAGMILSVRLPELLSNRDTTRFNAAYLGGLASVVGAVLSLSVAMVTLRKMKAIHFSVPVLYYGFIGIVENAAINAATSTFEYPECGWDSTLMMLVGIFGFLGQCSLGFAVQREAVSTVTIVKSSMDIIASMVLQIIFFDEKLDAYNISGACLVIASVTIMGIRNRLRMLPEESKSRKRFRFLLR